MYTYVDVTSYILLTNLPSDVARIFPWSSAGATNRADRGDARGLLAKIGAVASTLENGLVQFGRMISTTDSQLRRPSHGLARTTLK